MSHIFLVIKQKKKRKNEFLKKNSQKEKKAHSQIILVLQKKQKQNYKLFRKQLKNIDTSYSTNEVQQRLCFRKFMALNMLIIQRKKKKC